VGNREGDEVAQLYVQDLVANVARPVKELKMFKRVTLKPGENKEIIFNLTADDLAFLDTSMRRVVEPGEFKIMIGSSSEDIRLHASLNINRKILSDIRCVSIKIDKNTVAPGEPFVLTVRLKNNGPISDIVPIRVMSNNEELVGKNIELSPDETREERIRLALKGKGKKAIVVGIPKPSKNLIVTVRKKRTYKKQLDLPGRPKNRIQR
jgi:beta-glucosidase